MKKANFISELPALGTQLSDFLHLSMVIPKYQLKNIHMGLICKP
jgi:hypothetical protein